MKKTFVALLVAMIFSFLPSIGICDPVTINMQGTITDLIYPDPILNVGDQFTVQLIYNYDETLVTSDFEQLHNNSTYSIDFGHTTFEGGFDALFHEDDQIKFYEIHADHASEDVTFTFNTLSAGPLDMMPNPTSLTSATSIDFYVTSGLDGINGVNGVNGELQIVTEPVPEPATILLFGIGIVSIIGLRHRAKK